MEVVVPEETVKFGCVEKRRESILGRHKYWNSVRMVTMIGRDNEKVVPTCCY